MGFSSRWPSSGDPENRGPPARAGLEGHPAVGGGISTEARSIMDGTLGEWTTTFIIRNAPFWVDVFCKRYVRVIEGFRAAAVEKVDPAFADIEADAENSAEAEYERLMGLPSNGEIDPGDIAEQANEHGIEYLEVMSAMQQGVRNGLVVGLHHLLEQLQLAFFRQLALRTSEKPKDLQKLLLTCGIDTQGFSSSGQTQRATAGREHRQAWKGSGRETTGSASTGSLQTPRQPVGVTRWRPVDLVESGTARGRGAVCDGRKFIGVG